MSEDQDPEERPKRTWTPAQREAQMKARAAAAARRRGDPDVSRSDAELVAEDVIAEAVDNITVLAGYAMPIAPYTAITIAGVPDPEQEGGWLVRSRAQMAGNVLLEHAKRNPRILAVVARFNLMFKNVELLEVAGSVVAAAAVDAKMVEPTATVKLPGEIEFPILYPAIGDTIEYIAGQEALARGDVEGARVAPGPRPAADVEGPAQRDTLGRDVPTPEQLAQARATRERLRQRDEARANGHPEPTTPRQGQTIVPGDVTKT